MGEGQKLGDHGLWQQPLRFRGRKTYQPLFAKYRVHRTLDPEQEMRGGRGGSRIMIRKLAVVPSQKMTRKAQATSAVCGTGLSGETLARNIGKTRLSEDADPDVVSERRGGGTGPIMPIDAVVRNLPRGIFRFSGQGGRGEYHKIKKATLGRA